MGPTLNEFFIAANQCGRVLFRAFAAGLGLDLDHFTRHFDRPITRGALIFYPPQQPDLGDDQFGVAPHTDYGCLTLLYQDPIGGLQVQGRNGEWVVAPPDRRHVGRQHRRLDGAVDEPSIQVHAASGHQSIRTASACPSASSSIRIMKLRSSPFVETERPRSLARWHAATTSCREVRCVVRVSQQEQHRVDWSNAAAGLSLLGTTPQRTGGAIRHCATRRNPAGKLHGNDLAAPRIPAPPASVRHRSFSPKEASSENRGRCDSPRRARSRRS